MALPKNRKTMTPPQPVEEAPKAQRDLQGCIINPYDNNEKVFSQLPLDETINSDDDGQFTFEETQTKQEPQPTRTSTPTSVHRREKAQTTPSNTTNNTRGDNSGVEAPQLESRIRREERLGQNQPLQEPDNTDSGVVKLKNGNRRTEIDPKKKKILPFGSSRRQQKTTKAEREARKNISRQVNRNGKIFIALGTVILFAGLYGLVPKDGLTDKEKNEAAQISAQVSNTTGFPINAGGGIATDFIKAYLTVQSDSETNDILAYYYTGNTSSSSSASSNNGISRTATSSFSQTLLYEPTLYGAIARDATLAQYTVGAYVQKKATDGDKVTTEKPEMVFFSVNVVYNPETKMFAIAPDSPTIVPGATVNSQRELSPADTLGLGNADNALGEQIKSVVNGYVQGYATATENDTSALDQYTTATADISTKRGLGGKMELASGNSAVTYEAFPSAKDGDTVTEIKARVKVTWVDKVATDNNGSVSANPAQVTYGSQYVMTLERQADGRYLVSKFVPEAYVPSK